MVKTKKGKGRWGNTTPEERSKIMSRLAKRKHSMLSPEERKKHSDKMNAIKNKKAKINKHARPKSNA